MASLGQQVHCAGDRCNKMVFIEPNKLPLCKLHARAVKSPQALAKLKVVAEATQKKQFQARYKSDKWQKEWKRRGESDLRDAVKAQAAARAMPPSSAPRERFRNGRPPQGPMSGSSVGGYSPAPDRPVPEAVLGTISRAMAPRTSAHSGPRRFAREESIGPGNKVSKTGRARQAGFLTAIDDDDDLPENPIGSMAPPSRSSKHNTDKHKENIRHYDDYIDDNDRPINIIYSIRPRPLPDNEHSYQRTETLPKPRLNQLNRLGGIPDSVEEDEPVGYEETRRSMRNRFSKPRKSVPMAQPHINTTRDTKRPNDEDDSDQQAHPKRSRFKPDVLAQLSKAEIAPAPNQKKTWAVPKTVKSMLPPPPEIFADEDQLAQLPVDNLGLLGMLGNGSALPHGYGSYAASEGGMSQQTVPLGEKISMWHGIKVAGNVRGSSTQAMSQILSLAPVAQSAARTEGTIVRFERGTPKNKCAPRQPQTPPKRDLAQKNVPVVLLGSYQALDATDSRSSTSSGSASAPSVNNNAGDGAFSILQSLPKALKEGTLKSSTPQKGPKHGTPAESKNDTPATVAGKSQSNQHQFRVSARAKMQQNFFEAEPGSHEVHAADEELPSFAMDYLQQNEEEGETDNQMFGLLGAMDSEGNVMDDQASQFGGVARNPGMRTNNTPLQTISAKALRAREGLPADSPINEQMMLDLAMKVQHGGSSDTITTEEGTEEGEAALEHQLTIEEFEMKKKKFDEEREMLMKMIRRGEDAKKQKMVVRLWEKKLDEFVAEKGLSYKKEKVMFE